MQSVPGYTVIPSYTHPLARAAVVLPAFLAIAACSSVAGPGADDADGENEEDGHPVVIADGEGVSEGDLPEYPDRSAMLGQPCAYNVYSPPRDFWCLSVIEWIVCRPGRDRPGDRDDPDPPATYVALPIPPANQECENRDFCATRGCSVREHCREDTIDLTGNSPAGRHVMRHRADLPDRALCADPGYPRDSSVPVWACGGNALRSHREVGRRTAERKLSLR